MLAAAMALSFSACQNEEPLDAPVAKDALALMPAETPVGVQATLNNERGESRATRAEGDGAATNWYAWSEIHPTKEGVGFCMYLPGATDPTNTSLAVAEPIPFGTLPTTEPFSTLMLKDFNLTEGDSRCVSRWTALLAACNGWDNLFGFARLQADAQGNPVLNFGELKRAGTKVTLVLQDEQARPILVNDNRVSAKLSLQESDIAPIYTPEGETQGILFLDYLKDIKTLQADEAINPACFGWAAYSENQKMTFSLGAMSNADGTVEYYGDQNNTLTTLVRPTPTHTKDGDSFTLIENPQFTDAEVLTITVNTDPDGADGLLITGTYTLKLKDVKVTENGQQKPLTALKSGEHLTLTVTLAHNMKASATATIGDWDEVSADVDLNQDPSKMQPYTYDAESDTYTVYLAEGLYAWAAAVRKAMNDGEETHPNLILAEDITLPAKTNKGLGEAITVADGEPSGSNWTPIGVYDGIYLSVGYKGNIDGRGHTISGLRIYSVANETGFLGALEAGYVVKNLTFADAVVYSTKIYTAVVTGNSYYDIFTGNYAIVDNCHVTGSSSVKSDATEVGGIVGQNGGLMMGCTNAAAVETTSPYEFNNVGGIVGANAGTIIACANTGSVTNPSNDNSEYPSFIYACWSTAARDFEINYGEGRTACYIIEGNTITKADNFTAVATIDEAVSAMNTAISDYNASAAEGKKCPYTWELPQGESTPKLKKSNP